MLLEAMLKNDTSKVNKRNLVRSTRRNKKSNAWEERCKEDRGQNEFNSSQARQASYGSTNQDT